MGYLGCKDFMGKVFGLWHDQLVFITGLHIVQIIRYLEFIGQRYATFNAAHTKLFEMNSDLFGGLPEDGQNRLQRAVDDCRICIINEAERLTDEEFIVLQAMAAKLRGTGLGVRILLVASPMVTNNRRLPAAVVNQPMAMLSPQAS